MPGSLARLLGEITRSRNRMLFPIFRLFMEIFEDFERANNAWFT